MGSKNGVEGNRENIGYVDLEDNELACWDVNSLSSANQTYYFAVNLLGE